MPTKQEYDEARENWDSMTGEEKENFVEDIINDTLDSYGYDQDVEVKTDDLSGKGSDDVASYKDGVATFDEDYLYSDGDFDDVVDTALHETAHAMQDPDEPDWYSDEYEDDAENFAEDETANQLGYDFDWNDPALDQWTEDNKDNSFYDLLLDEIMGFWEGLWGSGT